MKNIIKNKLKRIEIKNIFSSRLYLELYPDVQDSGDIPLIHYIMYGRKEGRSTKYQDRTKIVYKEIYTFLKSKDVDISKFKKEKEVEMKQFLKNWINKNFVIPKIFSAKHYLENNEDVKLSGANPFVHYVLYGVKEGRIGYVDISNKVKKGNKEFDNNKENIVFITHESSSTGAPLLGYSIAEKLSQKYNIIHIVLKSKNIHEMFYNNCCLMLEDVATAEKVASLLFLEDILKTKKIKAMVINSIVGHNVLQTANKLNIPVVFLIHEFAEYTRPVGTMVKAVSNSSFIVVPAETIKNSLIKEFTKLEINHSSYLEKIKTIPQGKLPVLKDNFGKNDDINELYLKLNITPNQNVKIIVGCGWVQMRKGVDLFISTARYIHNMYEGECRFVWVGGGFNPENDVDYSVYLERELEYSNLGDSFIFLEHQKNLDNIFSISDVFCLTSRMDPFPNVAIDALSHDLHIACFDGASGTAEFLRKYDANCTIVDFLDTYKLAEGVTNYFKSNDEKIGFNKRILENHLNFNKYVEQIDELINDSVK
ncbi:MAG: glycosyltransferase [Aliarcobacter sp.]|nr:glycosyltransferase [Aliarcobacter sp.]